MDTLRQLGRQTFSSLSVRNYRFYFVGQGLSHGGNWMQTVGLGWLVLQLTGSGTALGGVLAMRFLPMLLGSPFTGVIVDRFDKRRLLYITQSAFALLALALAVLVYTDTIRVWMLFLFGLGFGLFDVIDSPTRQIFVHQMVGPEHLRNAVTLNSTEANLARALGPLLAGTLIATVGIAFCFFANSLSFLAVIIVISFMRRDEFHMESAGQKKTDHLLSGVYYAASVPVIRNILLAMAVIGTLSYEFQVSLPLLAQTTFSGTAADYAALLSAMGAGSVAGGLFAASRHEIALHEFLLSALLFGFSMCVTALMPTLGLATVGMIFVGFFSINLTSTGNTMIQLESVTHMRGRVMSLWSMALFGSTLIGAPIIGFLGQYASPRFALAAGGIAAILTAVVAGRKTLALDKFLTVPAFIRLRRDEEASGGTKV